MQATKKAWTALLVFFDILSAIISWISLYIFRKSFIEKIDISLSSMLNDSNFKIAIFIIPIIWILIYYISGSYSDIFRKSRLFETLRTTIQVFIGVTLLFFLFLLDDIIINYTSYYKSYSFLFFVQLITAGSFRLILLSIIKNKLSSGEIVFNTLIIGNYQKVNSFYTENKNKTFFTGQKFVGYIDVREKNKKFENQFLPYYGNLSNLNNTLQSKSIEYVIIALDSTNHEELAKIINKLSGKPIIIKILPDMYDILSGKVKMEDVTGEPLITIYPEPMKNWQKRIKRFLDIAISVSALVILSPMLFLIGLKVKLSSKGPVFYSQERIGLQGKKFNIYKFRSMHVNAEKNGPSLSSHKDHRITKWGKVMRKWRLDELPQFWNTLKGEMSLVGPRPERMFFLNQMEEKAPYVKHLQRVKPGLTSLGMVKFGYAENVKEMIERLKFDIIYIENQSLLLDFKILIFTLETLIKGRGK